MSACLRACCLVLLATSACSVGGQYGYSVASTPAPSSDTGYGITQASTSARSSAINLGRVAGPFLAHELGSDAQLERLDARPDFAEYIVRGLRGVVVPGNNQWELLQVSFALTGGPYPQIMIIADGRLASGFQYPSDSQFTQSMQPEFNEALERFTDHLRSEFAEYIARSMQQ